MGQDVRQALVWARAWTLSVAALSVISIGSGVMLVHLGEPFSLARRDEIVAAARAGPILAADREGKPIEAALRDFAGNLTAAAATTAIGLSVVGAFPIVAYRGWIGGIVSVDDAHRSRLADPGRALYYLVTLALQVVPYSLAGGAGIALGVDAWRSRRGGVPAVLGVPQASLARAARLYALLVPLLLVASLWEFLAPR